MSQFIQLNPHMSILERDTECLKRIVARFNGVLACRQPRLSQVGPFDFSGSHAAARQAVRAWHGAGRQDVA